MPENNKKRRPNDNFFELGGAVDLLSLLSDKSVIFAVANTIYCVSYVLTNMVWLRFLAVVGAASTLPYFFLQQEPLYQALFWQSMFLLINLVNLIILLLAMRAPKLSEQEQGLLDNVFADLKPHELVPLLKAARVTQHQVGDWIMRTGQDNDCLFLLVEGSVAVSTEGADVALLGKHSFIGEMSFITGEAVSADVVARDDLVLYSWCKPQLDKLFKKHSLYRTYLFQLCGFDMAGKLRKMTRSSSLV